MLWIMAKCFQLQVGFAPDGPDLLSGFGCLYCLCFVNCTKFVKLILTKIIKIVATICQILRLKCIKFGLSLPKNPTPPRPFGSQYSDLLASILHPPAIDSPASRGARINTGYEKCDIT